MKFFHKFRALFCKEKLDAEMAEEIRAHVELHALQNEKRGMSADEARYAALREFGGVAQIKERCRDEQRRGFLWLDQFVQDLRYAVRTLAKARRHAAMATLTLALGIGFVAVQFSIVNAIQRGLPFADAERIMTVRPLTQNGRERGTPMSDFLTWRETQKSFVRLAAFGGEALEISSENLGARSFRGAAFSAGLLEMLGVHPVLGRSFVPEDERPDAAPVLLIGYRVWQNDFGGDPGIVGRVVRLRGESATIIGVMPDGFGFPETEQAWVNLRPAAFAERNRAGVHASAGRLVGRLRDNATVESARAEFDQLVRQSEPGAAATATPGPRARIKTVHDANGGKAGIIALSLLGVVGGVLALACLNVANLLSARALQRGVELAVRSALGASRGRLIRQLLTESMLLALAGAAGGFLLAAWAVPLINRKLGEIPDKPFWLVVELDGRVMGAAIVVTMVVGLLCGLFPALRATRRGVGDMLKDAAGGGGAGFRLGRINRALIVAQLAVSSALLIVTSVLVNTVWSASRLGLPFDTDRVLSAQLRLSAREFADAGRRARFLDELLPRLRALPGVASATMTDSYPVERSNLQQPVEIAGRSGPADDVGTVFSDAVAPGFFHDLQIPLREGREFTAFDGPGGERVAVINESFAQGAWPGVSALGKQFRRPDGAGKESWLTVVGVVADLPTDRTPRGRAYYHVPLGQNPPDEPIVYLRTTGEVGLLVRPLLETVGTLAPDVPVDRIMSLTARMTERVGPLPIFSALGLAFGASGLFLAAVGIYSVTSIAMHGRTREFGIRIALGALPRDVLRHVIMQGTKQLALGLVTGVLLGWAASQPVTKAVSAVAGPIGVLIYALIIVVIAATVTLALWFPASRASRVNPMVALRSE
jgi:putative ABC transport system permease protein